MAGRVTVLVVAVLLGVLGCYLVVLDRVSAQPEQQYGGDGQASPAPEQQPASAPADKITICHATSSATNPYVEITVSENSVRLRGHQGHPNDIIPAPPGGCPNGPEPTTPEPTTPEPTTPEPTTPEPTATSTPTATASPEPTTPEPTTPAPTTGSPTASASASGTTELTDDGGCPVPEPTTASPSASASATTPEPTTPEPTTPEPTATGSATASPTPEPTGGGTTPEPTDGSPSATASASSSPQPPVTVVPTTPATPSASPLPEPPPDQPFTPTPTAVATKPGENHDGPFEVTDPEGAVSTLAFFDLDVHDDPPLPGGPGGITRSEMRGQRAAAQSLVDGGDFHQAVAAAQPFLNACDSRDAVRLAAVQLGVGLPETGGAPPLPLLAFMLLVGSGIFAWRLNAGGRP